MAGKIAIHNARCHIFWLAFAIVSWLFPGWCWTTVCHSVWWQCGHSHWYASWLSTNWYWNFSTSLFVFENSWPQCLHFNLTFTAFDWAFITTPKYSIQPKRLINAMILKTLAIWLISILLHLLINFNFDVILIIFVFNDPNHRIKKDQDPAKCQDKCDQFKGRQRNDMQRFKH